MKAFCDPRVKLEVRSPKSSMLAQGVEAKVKTYTSGAKVSWGLMTTRISHWARN
jgi:hypothetical protein